MTKRTEYCLLGGQHIFFNKSSQLTVEYQNHFNRQIERVLYTGM